MKNKPSFNVEDPCFAKVRGWIPYPARIVGKKMVSKKEKFSVVFFETNETGDMGLENLWPVTSETIKKFVNEKSLKKKDFKAAFEEMKKYRRIDEEVGVEDFLVNETSDEEGAYGEIPKEIEATTNEGDGVTSVEDFAKAIATAALVEGEEANVCEASNEEVNEAASEEDHMYGVDNVDATIEEVVRAATSEVAEIATAAPRETGEGKTAKKSAAKSKESKKSKSKQAPGPSTVKRKKTLRETEVDSNEAFTEKIIVDGDMFTCKRCPSFVTKVKLLARSHANSCGSKKKVGRKAKKLKCDDCDEEFTGRKNLVVHAKQFHSSPGYQCSVCRKEFQYRANYRKHLATHNSSNTVECPYCSKTFKFESYKERHVSRVHLKKLNGGQDGCKDGQDLKEAEHGRDDEVDIVIAQNEDKIGDSYYYQLESTFPNTEKVRSSSYQQFFSTTGLYCKEDWDDWNLISQMLNIPVTVDGSNDGIEIAVIQHGNGDETVLCAGSGVVSEYDFIREIVEELVNSTVDIHDGTVVGGIGGTDAELVANEGGVIEYALRNPAIDVFENELEHAIEEDEGHPLEDVPQSMCVPQSSKGQDVSPLPMIVCPHCGASGFRHSWFLQRHISQVHTGSVKCEICENLFIDKFRYLEHSSSCFYWCKKEGCSFHEKRKSRVESHMRKHDREF